MTRQGLALSLFLALAQGCSSPAAKPLTPVLGASDGRAAAALYDRGVESAGHEDFSRAEQYLSAALARGYPESRAVPWLVRVCLSSARLRTALHYAEPYLARHPDDPVLLHLIATVRLSLEDTRGAQAALEHILDVAPDYAPARYLLAVVLHEAFGDRDAMARELTLYLQALPRGRHAGEARSLLREYATHRALAPIPGHGGGVGSRGSSSTIAPVSSRADSPVAR